MIYIEFGKMGFKTSILGLGAMRLPVIDGDDSKIDEEESIKLIRYAIDNGINYIDTAYVYHGGNSEKIVGKALRDGYRDKVKIATKSPVWLINSKEDFNKYFQEQLERLETEYIDIYLFHALDRDRFRIIQEYGGFEFLDEKIVEGKIKIAGFSFHDDYKTFVKIIDSYNWGMCLIQFNFIDEDKQAGVKGLKYAGNKRIPVAIMEPLKGGLLAKPPKEINRIWRNYPKNISPIEWAFRWIGNFNEVKLILSGMSNLEMLKENIDISKRLLPDILSADDFKLIKKVKEAYKSRIKIDCSLCLYCLPCPKGVHIPLNFKIYNEGIIYNGLDIAKKNYFTILKEEMRASNCSGCRLCENKCPQGINISQKLQLVSRELEET